MRTLLSYTADLENILCKYRNEHNGELTEMKQKDKIMAVRTLCKSFAYIEDTNLIRRLYYEVGKRFDYGNPRYSFDEIDDMLKYFDTFIAFEEQLFKQNNIPPWVVRETFESVEDLKPMIHEFFFNSRFRSQCLDTKEMGNKIAKIRETVCTINDDQVWSEHSEHRFILNCLTVNVANAITDVASSTFLLFTFFSSAASTVAAWKKAQW